MLTALKHTPNKQGFAECNWLQRLLGLTHVRTDPFVVKPGVQRQNCNGITVCAHSPGEQSNARSSPRLSQAIDLRRHAQALCNCLHKADLRCQLGYQISKDFPFGAAKMGNQRQFHAKQSSLPRHLIDQLDSSLLSGVASPLSTAPASVLSETVHARARRAFRTLTQPRMQVRRGPTGSCCQMRGQVPPYAQ